MRTDFDRTATERLYWYELGQRFLESNGHDADNFVEVDVETLGANIDDMADSEAVPSLLEVQGDLDGNGHQNSFAVAAGHRQELLFETIDTDTKSELLEIFISRFSSE